MSKSTPITNLPNIKQQGSPAYEERENQLVKEILNEIDNENKSQEPAGPTPEQQQQQQQMMQQQMMEQQMMEQQMMEQQQMQPNIQNAPLNVELQEPKSMVDNIVDMARQPLIVAVVCVLISFPQLSSGLSSILNKNAKLAKYSTILLLLVKGVLGGGMYFGINQTIN